MTDLTDQFPTDPYCNFRFRERGFKEAVQIPLLYVSLQRTDVEDLITKANRFDDVCADQLTKELLRRYAGQLPSLNSCNAVVQHFSKRTYDEFYNNCQAFCDAMLRAMRIPFGETFMGKSLCSWLADHRMSASVRPTVCYWLAGQPQLSATDWVTQVRKCLSAEMAGEHIAYLIVQARWYMGCCLKDKQDIRAVLDTYIQICRHWVDVGKRNAKQHDGHSRNYCPVRIASKLWAYTEAGHVQVSSTRPAF